MIPLDSSGTHMTALRLLSLRSFWSPTVSTDDDDYDDDDDDGGDGNGDADDDDGDGGGGGSDDDDGGGGDGDDDDHAAWRLPVPALTADPSNDRKSSGESLRVVPVTAEGGGNAFKNGQ